MFLIQPVAYGVMFGTGFGVYENICYAQIKNKPEVVKKPAAIENTKGESK